MAIRQEQVLFVVAAGLLGWWAYGDLNGSTSSGRTPRAGSAPELERSPAPEVSVALPGESRTLTRDLFTPPSDTAPLPPLDLVTPPRPAGSSLVPPPAATLAAASWSSLLDRPSRISPAPGLFEGGVPAESPSAPTADDDGADLAIGGGAGLVGEDDLLSAEERTERIQAWKRLYDWIEPANGGGLKFGTIVNGDRYSLAQRPEEPLSFVEVRPETGEAVHPPNFPPVVFESERLASWGLADTPANRVALFRARVGQELRPGDLVEAMQMVDLCIAERHGTPGLLETAGELCQLAASVHGEDGQPDPLAVLKYAEVLEAGFRGEEAFAVYQELLEQGQRTNPLVWARLARLEARYRLFEQAEEHFRKAVSLNGAHHMARLSLGQFLVERGRGAEAVPHLLEAEKREPRDAAGRALRLATRRSLGQAFLASGKPAEAGAAFRRALGADATDGDSLAGLLACAFLAGDDSLQAAAEEAQAAFREEGAGATFDLLVCEGVLAALDDGFQEALQSLSAAASSDPFRAHEAWRALSWLAERTGHPEEARSYIEQAWQASPTDAWTLYQRARLLRQDDDLEGAAQMLRDALDQELDFFVALAEMAQIRLEEGRLEDAELYFERALGLDPSRANVAAERGFNLLALGQVEAAEASFRASLGIDRGSAYARNGLAWCSYVLGDSREALTQYGELAELLRDAADPQRLHAEAMAARIVEHEAKEVWTDAFERASGMLLGNGWNNEIGFGPEITLEEGRVRLAGLFETAGTVRVLREEPVDAFQSFEATVTVASGTRARVGVFLARERSSRNAATQVLAAARVARSFGGAAAGEPMQVEFARQGESEQDVRDLFTTPWLPGEPIRLGITRRGDGSDAVVDLWVDGQEVQRGIPLARLFSGTSGLRFGVYVEGDQGRTCDVLFDDVRVVRRRP